MANVLSNSYGFWDTDGLVWTSNKSGDKPLFPGCYGHITFERASTDSTSGELEVWAWHTMNGGDLSGTGKVEVRANNYLIASGNYSATIGLEPTLLLSVSVLNFDPAVSREYNVSIKHAGANMATILSTLDPAGHTHTPNPTLTSVVKSETDTAWVLDVTYTSDEDTKIVIIAESGNKSVEIEEDVLSASAPTVAQIIIQKTDLQEVLKVSAGAFDDAHRALLVQEWERVVPPLFHVSNHYERSIGVGCYAAEQDNTLKIADDMEVIGGAPYSTTPVRIGRYKNTAYSVYKVVVPIAGTSSGSASFTAPEDVQRIVSIKGSGYNGTYWLPLPYVFTSLVNQATLRCEVDGASCTVNLVTGSNQSFVKGTVEAVVEFVC